ncbi:MAG: biotin--[acetyl-CoA-carboxylase] ligase [Gammaproteobacteria bacterium]
MQLAYETLKFLHDGSFYSGTDLAVRLRVSRTSIWKAIQFLQSLGLDIYAVPGKGYRLAEPLEMLDKNKISNALSPAVIKRMYQLDVLNLTTSTNDYVAQRAHSQALSAFACVAEGQTQGRGRLGRKWISPFGTNLYFSIYWTFQLKPRALSGLSLAVGVSVLKAIQILSNNHAIQLKWPNDLYYQDAKLGGILVEILPMAKTCPDMQTEAESAAVIGIGINVSAISDELKPDDRKIAALSQALGYKPSRNSLVAALLNELIPALAQFQAEGFSPFKQIWDLHDYLRGKHISLNLPKGVVSGDALGVNERGELCVEVAGQKQAFPCGEVSTQLEKNSVKNCYI